MNPDSSTVRPVMRLEFPKKEPGAMEEEQGIIRVQGVLEFILFCSVGGEKNL